MYISCSGATRLVVVADVGRRTPFRPALLRAVRCLRSVGVAAPGYAVERRGEGGCERGGRGGWRWWRGMSTGNRRGY